ncbi:hypothetical protein ROLI_011670 [Roseobacter fucihabitans]|uniref:DUF4177 domain-containing protein n=1 Tax=Roseobacter fucihabitans TaxID=1537242 RepID=A0ABZ2BQ34_9RHOB|nr:DUF4177 domain-containing protein [Roseobacter litoralis]MBC6964305.1 hypothetical protein [Roseobacter litoralis]
MAQFEYKVIAAPTRGLKAKGVKTPEDRFAHAFEVVMNDMAAEGWHYQRAETLPSVERAGLTSTATNWRNILIFRRETEAEVTHSPAPQIALTAIEDASARKEPVLNPPPAPAPHHLETPLVAPPTESDQIMESDDNSISSDPPSDDIKHFKTNH